MAGQHTLHSDLQIAHMPDTGKILNVKGAGGHTFGWGPTANLPSAATGWVPGAIWIDTTTGIAYQNTGTVASSTFVASTLVGAQTARLPIQLNSFRECDANGDVSNIAANGGILASDTTPILRGDATETQEIVWVANGVDEIVTALALPADVDGTASLTIDLFVKSSGATDAPRFDVKTSWDGAAQVADIAVGSVSASLQTITATVAAADVPDTTNFVTLVLKPNAHSTDTWSLYGARINYTRKIV